MFLGKDVRLSRIVNRKSGRMLAITVDHPITRGMMPGLVDIRSVMKKVVAGSPDAITMHKGIAEKVFAPYAGQSAIILKASAYSVQYHALVVRQLIWGLVAWFAVSALVLGRVLRGWQARRAAVMSAVTFASVILLYLVFRIASLNRGQFL